MLPYTRHPVSLPCSVIWEEDTLPGTLKELSFGGALAVGVTKVLPIGTSVVLAFEVDCEEGLML